LHWPIRNNYFNRYFGSRIPTLEPEATADIASANARAKLAGPQADFGLKE
jgi:hypothetical protein